MSRTWLEVEDNEKKIKKPRLVIYISWTIFVAVIVLVILGFNALGVASSHINPTMWFEIGGDPPNTYIIDYWGLQVEPEFFVYRQIALYFLFLAVVLYPLWMWIDQTLLDNPIGNFFNIGLILGLFIPSLFIYGNPAGIFHEFDPSTFQITGVISPIFNFFFSGESGADTELTISGFKNPFAILGLILLGLAVFQYMVLKNFEKDKIELKLFLVPVILNVTFIWLLLLIGLPEFVALGSSVTTIAKVCIPIPMFSVAILIRGLNHKRLKSI